MPRQLDCAKDVCIADFQALPAMIWSPSHKEPHLHHRNRITVARRLISDTCVAFQQDKYGVAQICPQIFRFGPPDVPKRIGVPSQDCGEQLLGVL